jgi:SAM-dependent methyltransferase
MLKFIYHFKQFSKFFFDGERKYGYGGYKYIPGYLEKTAKKIISYYKLNNKSKILDIGCGKGFLLFEIKKLLPEIRVKGFDISKYAIKNSKREIREHLFV